MTEPIGEGRPSVVRTTGVGSMPGSDAREAARIVSGELLVPHLAELPARGPGADMIGRTLALVSAATGEFGAETTPTGWRLAGGRSGSQPGRAMRRGVSWLGEDADRLEEALAGFTGPVKVQVTGPWTLAAGIETASGTRLLADPGACAELGCALVEALAGHLREVARRLPGAALVAQLDEPTLPLVLAGGLRTASGRGAVRTPEPAEVVAVLAAVVGAAGAVVGGGGCGVGGEGTGLGGGASSMADPVESASSGAVGPEPSRIRTVLHCCASRPPFDAARRAGFDALSVDLGVLRQSQDEQLGAWWDQGGALVLGVAPSTDPDPRRLPGLGEELARTVDALWRRIGFGVAQVGARTWLSPGCGLAGASPGWSRQVGGHLRHAAALLDSAD